MWQDQSYSSSSSAQGYYTQPQGAPLQFYSPGPTAGAGADGFYNGGARPSLEGQVSSAQGSMSGGGGDGAPGYGGSIQAQGGWLSAFGSGGFEGEPPLLEGMWVSR
jgi:hypothetical protein